MTSSVQAPAPADRPGAPRAAGAGPTLTLWERTALTAAASGLTADTAARLMGTSGRTLRRAQRAAADRLGVPTTVQAVAIAAAAGLIDMNHVRHARVPAWPCELPEEVRAAAHARTGRATAERVRAAAAKRARIAELLARGLTVREVADAAGLPVTTVRRHRREIQRHAAGEGGGGDRE